jgi:hypothetical protein
LHGGRGAQPRPRSSFQRSSHGSFLLR